MPDLWDTAEMLLAMAGDAEGAAAAAHGIASDCAADHAAGNAADESAYWRNVAVAAAWLADGGTRSAAAFELAAADAFAANAPAAQSDAPAESRAAAASEVEPASNVVRVDFAAAGARRTRIHPAAHADYGPPSSAA